MKFKPGMRVRCNQAFGWLTPGIMGTVTRIKHDASGEMVFVKWDKKEADSWAYEDQRNEHMDIVDDCKVEDELG